MKVREIVEQEAAKRGLKLTNLELYNISEAPINYEARMDEINERLVLIKLKTPTTSKLGQSFRSMMVLDLSRVQPLFDSESSSEEEELDEKDFDVAHFKCEPNSPATFVILSKLKVFELRLLHCSETEDEVTKISNKIREISNILEKNYNLCYHLAYKEKMVNQPAVIKERMTKALWPQLFTNLIPWFKYFFQGRDYLIVLAQTKRGDWLGVLKKEERSLGASALLRGLLCTSTHTKRFVLDDKDVDRDVLENWTKCYHYIFNLVEPAIKEQRVKLEPIRVDTFEQEFMDFEKILVRGAKNTMKVGLVLVKNNQTDEANIFGNETGSLAYQQFLDFLGQEVCLKGWDQYAAELDTEGDATGTHSLFLEWQQLQIMFHVATMIKSEASDKEGFISKKRYIGNDLVVIVFLEEDHKDPFNICYMPSGVTQVLILVKPVKE
eukprot:TRINITY_DN1546_c1_g3_i2.p1 TRINITY_DN1546_c1_g3~~TRINITY_DN1546_c1_g3_i2.p1  ORF type:complete len:515 (-),score=112.65 TRINITY_DN1546_c1_g3_i2:31-1344(-)